MEGVLNEPGKVKVNGEPARMRSAMSFEATVNAVVRANQFAVEAKDGSENSRTITYEVAAGGAVL